LAVLKVEKKVGLRAVKMVVRSAELKVALKVAL